MTDFLEVLHQLLNEGITWSSAIAIVLAFLKLNEGRHKRKVNESMRRDIAAIKEHLCIATTSETNLNRGAKRNAALSSRPWVAPSPVNIVKPFTILRGKKQMVKSINYVTLIVALLGAAKIILETFGISFITDDMIDKAANVVAGLVTLVGVIISHSKTKGATSDDFISNTFERTE